MSLRCTSSLYCPMRNSDQMTIGEMHPTLIYGIKNLFSYDKRNDEHVSRGCSRYHCHCSSQPKLVRKTRKFVFFETGCSYSVESMGFGYLMGYPDRCTVRRVDCKWHLVEASNQNLPCQLTQAEEDEVVTVK